MARQPDAPVDLMTRIKGWGLPTPDAHPLVVGEAAFPMVWRSHLVVATEFALTPEQQSAVEALGFSVVRLDDSSEPPTELRRLLGVQQ